MASSCQPGHTKRNIAYFQAFRVCRIYSNTNLAKTRCAQLEQYLILRGHSKHKTRRGIERAIAVFSRTLRDLSFRVSRYFVQTSHSNTARREYPTKVVSSDHDHDIRAYRSLLITILISQILPAFWGNTIVFSMALKCWDWRYLRLHSSLFPGHLNLRNVLVRSKLNQGSYGSLKYINVQQKWICKIKYLFIYKIDENM